MSALLQRRLKAFEYHAPSKATAEVMRSLRTDLQSFTGILDNVLPESGDAARYTALAFTALEECAMWAMKALSHEDPEGKVIGP